MIRKPVGCAILPILFCLGFAVIVILAIFFVSLCVAVMASVMRPPLIHAVALPTLAVAFAASAFPWQLAAGRTDSKAMRTIVICGQCMFTGSMLLASAYAAYWSAVTAIEAQLQIHQVLLAASYWTACVIAIIGFTAWSVGLLLFYVSFCFDVSLWDTMQ